MSAQPKDGGPAFPTPAKIRDRTEGEHQALLDAIPGAAGSAWEFKWFERAQSVMSLRDWFAGQAPVRPPGWGRTDGVDLGGGGVGFPSLEGNAAAALEIKWRWHYADAMLAERAKPL